MASSCGITSSSAGDGVSNGKFDEISISLDVMVGAECFMSFQNPSQVELNRSKRHKVDDTSLTTIMDKPLPTSKDNFESIECETEIHKTVTDNKIVQYGDSLSNSDRQAPMGAIGPGGVSGGSPRTRAALDYRYDEAERGPCKVVIERSANSDLADKDLNRFKYAKLFNVTHKNSIVDVNSSGFGKLAVITKSARKVNVILNDRSLEGMGQWASIPSYFVSSQDIIRGIPLDMTEQEIRDNLVTLDGSQRAVSLSDVRRLDRKNIN